MVTQAGYSVARRSGGRMTPCAICTVHVETRSTGLLVEPQNQGDGLLVVWLQNHWDSFLQFGHKIDDDGFSQFGLKTGAGFLS
jgi:hypothetical protein